MSQQETPPRHRRPRWQKFVVSLLGLTALALLAAFVAFDILKLGSPKLPPPSNDVKLIPLAQNVSDGWGLDGYDWFHHARQGTTIMPAPWFLALDRPEIAVFLTPEPFVTADYMSRFGFLPSSPDPRFNPDGRLPVGFALEPDFDDPVQDRVYKAVGLTCAACHTGKLTIETTGNQQPLALRVEGGSSMIDLRAFQQALGQAVYFTLKSPVRFSRFARRVLTDAGTTADRAQLKADLQAWFSAAQKSQQESDRRHIFNLQSGFSRTDALALIGNRVFGRIDDSNFEVATAPVNFPHIWDTSWFDWVQYNGSIRMVMVRNIGEALGVGAVTNTDLKSPRFLQSSVDVANLHRMEDFLGGPAPFQGLRAPQWADAVTAAGFPPLDQKLVTQGRQLYDQFCASCHLPPVDDLLQDLAADSPQHWTEPSAPPFDKRFLKLPMIDLPRIGTDPAQAAGFAFRSALVPDPLDPQARIALTASKGLRVVTEAIRTRAYNDQKLSPDDRAHWDRWRQHDLTSLDSQVVRARLAYKARPLDGIWATPPYLHNGSILNLDELLRPVSERARQVPLGSTRYDTTLVGYKPVPLPGGFTLDTRLPGNRNTGHEFRDLSLIELEVDRQTDALAATASLDERWAQLMEIDLETYKKLDEPARARKRRELTLKALSSKDSTFVGIVGPLFTSDERKALLEYLKSL